MINQETCDKNKSYWKIKNIEGLEALWQNFFQWTAEQEGPSQPPVSFQKAFGHDKSFERRFFL